ncbi:hypothetical protein JCGZ_17397 [Jatropha curcas]|uniref:Uncharacterized protein n=1 Tax=Jatropha curcas TaxID=180498 RepID=A0A067LLY9_JATCU|nr:hypothetical protein JCGZ_17397 [Jatropha curcas]
MPPPAAVHGGRKVDLAQKIASPTVSKKATDHGGFTNLHQKSALTEGKGSHGGEETIDASPSCYNRRKQRGSPEILSRDLEIFQSRSSSILASILRTNTTNELLSSRGWRLRAWLPGSMAVGRRLQ